MDEFENMEWDYSEDDTTYKDEEYPRKLSDDDILRWVSWTKPFPFPDHMTPTEPELFEDISDDVLLDAPPHMIVHMQRTASQGGLQIVSPRQTPVTSLMSRVCQHGRMLGDHVVGSVAIPDSVWPTIDGDTLERLLPDEPLMPEGDDIVVRAKTRTEPLTRAGHLMRDPILSCLIKGRAVIDVLMRDDVMGDGDRMTELLAEAWGIHKTQLMDLDAFSLGYEGPLLRHALKADEVYPMVHAPIHQKKCVRVSSNEATREMLPADSAMDWRRMRVFCEAVFLMMCSIEAIPLRAARAIPPPGDPTAPLNRPNILAFMPAPCIAWSCDPTSFSVCPKYTKMPNKIGSIPREVMQALSLYVELVRPMSHAMAVGHRAIAKRTTVDDPSNPVGETLSESYRLLGKTIMVGAARGRNSARAVRNLIYEAVMNAPMRMRLRVARYLHIAKTEVRIHLDTEDVPDYVVDKIATKFLSIGDTIRMKVVAEAARRGQSAEQWWSDILAQAPDRYRMLVEGTMGWAKVSMWLIFKQPTEKWGGLERTMHYAALRDAEFSSVGSMSLPPVKGSIERLLAATRAVVKQTASAYAGYYMAVSDVGMALSDVLESQGKLRSSETLREASYLWVLRSRCLRGTNINPVERKHPTPSENHLRVYTTPVDLLVVPAPYRAFEAYRAHLETSSVVHKSCVKHIGEDESVRVSDVFKNLRQAMAPCKESLVTKYLLRPWELGSDMEKAWSELRSDVEKASKIYGLDQPQVKKSRKSPENTVMPEEPFDMSKIIKQARRSKKNYFMLMGDLDPDEIDWFEDVLAKLDPSESGDLMEREFDDVNDMRKVFLAADEGISKTGANLGETVM